MSGVFRVGLSHVRLGSMPVSAVDVGGLRRPATLSVVLYASWRPPVMQVRYSHFIPVFKSNAGSSLVDFQTKKTDVLLCFCG